MAQQVTRLWLMYPARLITRPVIYELGREFAVVTNIRQASVTEEIGVDKQKEAYSQFKDN